MSKGGGRLASTATRAALWLMPLALSGVIACAADEQLTVAWATMPMTVSSGPLPQQIVWAEPNTTVTFLAIDADRMLISVKCGSDVTIPSIELNAEELPRVMADVCANNAVTR